MTDTCHNANPQGFGEAYTPLGVGGGLFIQILFINTEAKTFLLAKEMFRRDHLGGGKGSAVGSTGRTSTPLGLAMSWVPERANESLATQRAAGHNGQHRRTVCLRILMIQKPTPRMPGIGWVPTEEGTARAALDSVGGQDEGEDRSSDLHINPRHMNMQKRDEDVIPRKSE